MTEDAAILSLLARLERSMATAEAQIAALQDENAALRKHIADHPANQAAV